jgi:predicted RNA-binding Zn-ribbon protein involved in translation (DUF1610 family)
VERFNTDNLGEEEAGGAEWELSATFAHFDAHSVNQLTLWMGSHDLKLEMFQDAPNDGHCLIHSLHQALRWVSPESVLLNHSVVELRKLIVEYAQENCKEMVALLETELEASSFHTLAESTVFLPMELCSAAASFLERDIIVVWLTENGTQHFVYPSCPLLEPDLSLALTGNPLFIVSSASGHHYGAAMASFNGFSENAGLGKLSLDQMFDENHFRGETHIPFQAAESCPKDNFNEICIQCGDHIRRNGVTFACEQCQVLMHDRCKPRRTAGKRVCDNCTSNVSDTRSRKRRERDD